MTELAQLVQREQRRHGAIGGAVLLAAVAAGTMITNERGVFSVLTHGGPLSALERAFAALVDGDAANPNLFGGPVYRPGGFYPAGGARPLRDGVAPAPNALPGNGLPGILDRAITPDGVAGPPAQDGLFGGDDVGPGPDVNGFAAPGGGPALVGVGNTPTDTVPVVPNAPVPEPAIWALMIGGLGLVGAAMRRGTARRRRIAFRAAK